jgi:hypothetical protein
VSGCPGLPISFSANSFSGRYSEGLPFPKEAVNDEGLSEVTRFP